VVGKDVSKILAIAEPIAAERGLEVLDIEIAGSSPRQLVRVLLDHPDESQLVSIEDCAAVSRRLGDGLEAYEVLRGQYMLEVSSPGVNRPLKKPVHFHRVSGSRVKVRTKAGEGERRNFLGRLTAVDETGIEVTEEAGPPVRIAFTDIDKANLEFEFEQKPGRAKRR
jgi:ribosome maturation factor RimP